MTGAVLAAALGTSTLAAVTLAPGPAEAPGPEPVILLLEVSVNGWRRNLVAAFRQDGERLSLPADQYSGLGFALDPSQVETVDGEPRVFLDRIAGLTWRIDMAAQTIDLQAPVEALTPERLSISPPPERVDSRADWSAFLSYDAFGEWAAESKDELFTRTGTVDLEARLIAPWFTFGSAGFVTPGPESAGLIRLETALTFDRPDDATSLMLGDGYSGALSWTRSLRFGGAQYRRDFGLRPDLVTQPMPQFSTGVTAPSALDLYVNGVERFAASAAPGSLLVRDMPVTTGANEVRIVLTDPSGRRREVYLPFYVSTELLAPGLTDFTLEAGSERRDYATKSASYGDSFASGSIRHGVSETLTAEFHAEAADDFAMAGAGGHLALWDAVILSGIVAGSRGPAGDGYLWSLGVERTGPRISATVRYEEASQDFEDLAARFGQPRLRRSLVASGSWQMSARQSANVTYVLQDRGKGFRSEVITANLGRSFWRSRLRADLSGYADLTQRGEWGASLMLSFPLGRRAMATVSAAPTPDFTTYAVTANGDGKDPRFSWSGRYARGPETSGNVDPVWEGARLDAYASYSRVGPSQAVQAQLGQSLVFIDGGLHLASRIDDAFTVVELPDTPGVEVFLENRPAGRTGRNGRLLINRLQGGEANAISIAALDLPITSQADAFAKTAAPRRGSGVVTRFRIDHQMSAVVVLADRAQKPLPLGAEVRLAGGDETAAVGYGGEAYLRGVRPGENRVTVRWPDGQCEATFDIQGGADTVPRVRATPCE
ncbi:fimbria/pilus outer membrane usher protein [Phenylobacterium sp. J367]|uniref:fimbria/pilus outer membrane usher protein n=1 Tax=Phenylobacterium sp. J367 TaxID=2898435 RepID=UPI002151BD20|nr:fimbria/pilus outer membrane usher protein [Phenylobacterium sp. J367]MCR5877510.1 fimbria/pilus outer membrane usher protein [Phenylobacterium sp. J367]